MRQPKEEKLNNPVNTQWCSRCNEVKPKAVFPASGRRYWCRPCNSKYQSGWVKSHPEKRHGYSRKGALRRSYKMTEEDYENMSKKQDGLCAICSKPNTSKRNAYLQIDHNHVTGMIRGLLCDKCNRGLGYFNDSSKMLDIASKYLAFYDQQEMEKFNN